jgi:N-acylneuraminate cytidylyltransferase
LLSLAGKPLLAHSIEHALNARSVDRVFVSTEDPEVADVAKQWGAEVILRPSGLAEDTSTSEAALLHAIDHLRDGGLVPDLVVFLQCTSPMRAPDDIDNAVAELQSAGADSLLSGTASRHLVWRRDGGVLTSLNYDFKSRQREQEMPEEFVENGSIYVFKPWVLRTLNNRLGGKIALYEMDYWSSFQVDSIEDFSLSEWVLRHHEQPKSTPISPKLIVFDFDGVFTDNRVLVGGDGSESVLCSRADSWGIRRLKGSGVPMVVLSTESHPVVAARCEKLGLECYQGAVNKLERLHEIFDRYQVGAEQVAYLGNDDNDLECLRAVGLGVVVADASPRAIDAADLVLTMTGGNGAIRELAELVLESLNSGAEAPQGSGV